jgi:protein-L-isoaspartate(D-aspartate) O-methyltransferase
MTNLAGARQRFARAIVRKERISSTRLSRALSIVERERFLGEGPWRVRSVVSAHWTTLNSDPVHIYEDVLVALDARRGIYNGLPSLWARVFDRLRIKDKACVIQIGCGTGYYSAILSHLVGPKGRVIAVDDDKVLVDRARRNLQGQANVEVVRRDGCDPFGIKADVVVVHAGFAQVHQAWLDALRPGGTLFVPITNRRGQGTMFMITRSHAQYRAEAVGPIQIMASRHDGAVPGNNLLLRWWEAKSQVRSLRRDAHAKDRSCWLHRQGACLSTRWVSKKAG